jgi:hypothetical protein
LSPLRLLAGVEHVLGLQLVPAQGARRVRPLGLDVLKRMDGVRGESLGIYERLSAKAFVKDAFINQVKIESEAKKVVMFRGVLTSLWRQRARRVRPLGLNVLKRTDSEE